MKKPTPETDAVAEKINFGVDIDFARKLERERDEARRECKFLWDERDEAMELLESEKNTRNHIIQRGIEIIEKRQQERDEAREENKKLREALLRVRTWGISSKNFSATDSYKMAEWIDDGCAGELPKPDGPWIYEIMEGTK